MCIRYYYLGTSERSYNRGYGGRVCPGKAPEGPARLQQVPGLSSQGRWVPPGCGELQDHSSLRGLLAPRVRWGCRGWTNAFGVGEGSGLEMSRKSLQGGRGKARRRQVGHRRLCARDRDPDRSNSEPERRGHQGLSFILLFICKTAMTV